MREAGIKVKDIFVIFYYDIFNFKESELFKLNVNMHSLCTQKEIINQIESEKIYSEDEVLNLKEFLEDAENWRSKYA